MGISTHKMVKQEALEVDILAIGAHPDDVELSCSGTLLAHKAKGYRFGILDLTRGELGTRGTVEIRRNEAFEAAQILDAEFRLMLDMKDGFFENNQAHILPIVKVIRACRPKIILCNALSDRHPDHGRAASLVKDACFYAGLRKVETLLGDQIQEAWRPDSIYFYIQDQISKPDLVVETTAYMDQKIKSIEAFSSQFYNKNSTEPESPISSKDFLDFVRARDKVMGRFIAVEYAEGFHVSRPIGIKDLFEVV